MSSPVPRAQKTPRESRPVYSLSRTSRMLGVRRSDRSIIAGRALRATRALPRRNQSKTLARRSYVASILANFWIVPGPPSCTPDPQPSTRILYQNDAPDQRPQFNTAREESRTWNDSLPNPGCLLSTCCESGSNQNGSPQHFRKLPGCLPLRPQTFPEAVQTRGSLDPADASFNPTYAVAAEPGT